MPAEELVAFEPGLADEVHEAEAARIGVDDAQTVIAGEDDVIMGARTFIRCGGLVIEFAERASCGPWHR